LRWLTALEKSAAGNLAAFAKDTLGDTSPLTPALASLNGNMYIAWKGDGNDNLNGRVICTLRASRITQAICDVTDRK
jgi:hypothetical protein